VRVLSWDQVFARRLRQSRLDDRAARDRLLEVARTTCGVHAQLASGAELALSARVEGVRRDDVRDALWQTRTLVKAGTLRTTLHLHPSDDVPLWKSVRMLGRWREQRWLDWQGLTLAEAEGLREAVLAALDDGEPRTRTEIGAVVGGRLGAQLASDSWGHYLAPASSLLCHGPPRGRNVTFVRCDRWVRGWQAPDPHQAQLEACRRYLAAYGPARRHELEHWLSWKVDVWDELELEEVDVEGYRTYVRPGMEFPGEPPRGVRLLSHYDVYMIGCHPRDRLIPEQQERIFLRGAGPNPALLVDGRVAGVWTREQRGRRTTIRVEPFRRLTKAQRTELEDDAARVARTFGTEPVLQVA
jgi:winged helix DNA-binding protein